ncbi:nuclease [Arthrobacter phage AbbyDaisy]|nr:nuclease [Arthrobacter phage AbbyDaisy]
MKHTASTMTDLLRQHYNPDGRAMGHLFMPEIGAPDGRRRADLLVAPISIAGAKANTLIGHEIKVTRSDVMAELADPTKADPWLRYCSRWYLVVADPALVEGLTIPDLWGVMAPPSGRRTRSMTILREAPKLTPDGDLSPVVSRLAAYMVNRLEGVVGEAQRDRDYWKRRAEQSEQREQEARVTGGAPASPHTKRVNAIVNLVERSRHDYENNMPWLKSSDLTEQAIADGILDLARSKAMAREVREGIDRTIREVERALNPFEHLAKQLAAVKAKAANLEAVPTGAASVIQEDT